MENVYIIGGLRSHIGVKNGVFKHVLPEKLGAHVLKELIQKQIYDKLKRKLSPYEIPKKIFFVKEFPLNDSGKINKNALKSQYLISSKDILRK